MPNNYAPNWPQDLINRGETIAKSLDFASTTPSANNVLRFLHSDPLTVKVVIIGQDPYPTKGVANGRAFAVNKGAALPASLRNLFKEIKEVQGQVFTDETLDNWERQGVLLLNASLTTEVGRPLVHAHLWSAYTDEVVKYLDQKNPRIIWVLWGSFAQSKSFLISGRKIVDAHPSPLSFRRRKGHTFKELSFIKW